MWDWDSDTGRIKNRYGICVDAPSPQTEGVLVANGTSTAVVVSQSLPKGRLLGRFSF